MINLVIDNKNIKVLDINNYNNNLTFNTNILKKIDKSITHLIIGDDLLLKLNTFIDYEFILKNYYLIVINRENNIYELINKYYYNYKDKFIIINKKYKASSTKARDTKSIKYLDKKVLEYIRKNNLYN